VAAEHGFQDGTMGRGCELLVPYKLLDTDFDLFD
jgi:hypothetical protein